MVVAKSKSDRKRERELFGYAVGAVICATGMIVLTPLVPAVGPIQREAFLLVGSAVLVGAGWLIGALGTDKI